MFIEQRGMLIEQPRMLYKNNIPGCYLNMHGYYFEHALLETIKNLKDYAFTPFLFIPRIEGFSGTTSEQYHANRRSLIFNVKYAKYAIWQRKRFYKKYRNNE